MHNRTMYEQITKQQKQAGARPVCLKLHKSIYGLKQAGRVWNKTFEEFLQSQNLTKSPTDPCLFVSQGNKTEDFFAVGDPGLPAVLIGWGGYNRRASGPLCPNSALLFSRKPTGGGEG